MTKKCPQCGTELPNPARFCSNCGVSLRAQLDGDGSIAQGQSMASGRQGVTGNVRESIIVTGDNNSVSYIIHRYLNAGGHSPDQTNLRQQIAGYLTWMRERFGAIELRGIKREGQQVVQLDLETVYVPLEAEVFAGLRRGRLIRLDQVLTRTGADMGARLTVTGGPGCGKTTVLQHIAWTLTSAIAADDPGIAQRELGLEGALSLPIFIPLSAYAQHLRKLPPSTEAQERTLAAFISRYLIERQSGLDIPRDFFARLLANGQAVILLLDGLDEVPDENERARVRQAIEDLVTGRQEMQVVVTCRTAAYWGRTALGRGFREIRVRELQDKHIDELIRQAYAAIYPHDPTARQEKSAELLGGIRNLERERRHRLGEGVERLVSSPLLVRMLLVVHFSARRLPEQRAELYMKATDAMLLPTYGPDEEVTEQIGQLVGGSREVHRDLVQHLAFAMHRRGKIQGREISETDLRKILGSVPSFAPDVDDFIALTQLRGTLVEERLGAFRFIHLAFQEYLVARYLAEVKRGEGGVQDIAAFFERGPILDSWWREPVLLVAGYLSLTSPQTARLLLLRFVGADAGTVQRPAPSPNVQLAMADAAAMAYLEWQTQDAELRHVLAKRIAALFGDTALMNQAPPALRAAAGNALARLGDPRFREDVSRLLNEQSLGFIEIPAGPFLMGTRGADVPVLRERFEGEREWYERETPQHEVTLPLYYIARYPVTIAQFRAFVRDSGYQPGDADSLQGPDNHPVTAVSWYDALEYCKWLTEKLGTGLKQGWTITLPSEAEWEKAARGTVGQCYPWGDELDPNMMNCADTGIGTTSAVGCFPGGASCYGVEDLSGNVWEWTRSLCKDYPYDPGDGREDSSAGTGVGRVLRGGAFNYDARFARCTVRSESLPQLCIRNFGFRIVFSSPNL